MMTVLTPLKSTLPHTPATSQCGRAGTSTHASHHQSAWEGTSAHQAILGRAHVVMHTVDTRARACEHVLPACHQIGADEHPHLAAAREAARACAGVRGRARACLCLHGASSFERVITGVLLRVLVCVRTSCLCVFMCAHVCSCVLMFVSMCVLVCACVSACICMCAGQGCVCKAAHAPSELVHDIRALQTQRATSVRRCTHARTKHDSSKVHHEPHARGMQPIEI